MGRKSYEELEAEAKGILAQIATLESDFEKEEDEGKLTRLDSRIERLDARKEKLYDRMDKISDTEATEGDNEKVKEDVDDTVCTSCGADLEEEEDGILRCIKCGELYEVVEDE